MSTTTSIGAERWASLSAVEILTRLLAFLDNGTLIRDTSHDFEQGWHVRALPLVLTLKAAKDIADAGVDPAVVQAVAAERARCAQVARGMKIQGEPTPESLRMGRWAAYNQACDAIAAAIEGGGE